MAEKLSTTEIQEELLKIISFFDNVCRANNLHYFMMGGTLLGAVRHKGFIPWDDDGDFGMRVSDYFALINLIISGAIKSEDYFFALLEENSVYCMPFLKIMSRRISIVEESKPAVKQNLFIDVFPVSYCGDSLKEAIKNRKKYRVLYSLSNRKNYFVKSPDEIRNVSLNVCSKILSKKEMARLIKHFYLKLNKKKTLYSCDFDGNEKGIVPSYLFDKLIDLDFESIKLSSIAKYDEYLKLIFGDYMSLPNEKDRRSHIVSSERIKT